MREHREPPAAPEAIARRHDISVRVALGASRWRLARQSLIESLLLAAAGAALGLVFASWSSRLLVSQLSTEGNPIYLDLSFDWRLLAFTGGIAVATTVLFGLLPALRSSGAAPIEALKEQARGTATDSRARLSNGLVVVAGRVVDCDCRGGRSLRALVREAGHRARLDSTANACCSST